VANVQVYSKSSCPFCIRAKDLLKNKGVAFEEINLDGKDAELIALKERTGLRTVPQIFINGQLIGGFSELTALDSKGELNKMLGI
jgi:glutaredoxin 3